MTKLLNNQVKAIAEGCDINLALAALLPAQNVILRQEKHLRLGKKNNKFSSHVSLNEKLKIANSCDWTLKLKKLNNNEKY